MNKQFTFYSKMKTNKQTNRQTENELGQGGK